MNKPLQDITVLDFSQFLSGPSASLRLADMGARVIKVEHPVRGDICRSMYVSNIEMNHESSVFHAINRNKESYAANLKEEKDKKKIIELIKQVDVVIHNFRPGVMDRLGFNYATVKAINPEIIYGEISGYGKEGPWSKKPGQDLLLQSVSGLVWLSGSDKGPVPMGLAIVDIIAGTYLAQGILACLVRKGINNEGGLVEVSMLESIIDLQFETITTHYHDGGQNTQRSQYNNAHAYLGAPYGVYKTKNGYMSLAMGAIPVLGELLGCLELKQYQDFKTWFTQRDEIKKILGEHLKTDTTEKWLSILEPKDIWCAKVLHWKELFKEEGFRILNLIQEVSMGDGYSYATTRCPIKINDTYLLSSLGSPKIGEHTHKIDKEFLDY